MTPSQIVLGGGFYILLPKITKLIYGCFLGNIDDDDYWFSGHSFYCQDAQEGVGFGREDASDFHISRAFRAHYIM